MRINTAVYGQRVLTVAGNEYKLEGYYPALITEGQYLRLQQIRETIKYLGDVGTGEKNNINLLAGLKLFRCGHCGSTMMAMLHRESLGICVVMVAGVTMTVEYGQCLDYWLNIP